MSGYLIVVTGPMFAGKTTRLGEFLKHKKIVVSNKQDSKEEVIITFDKIKVYNNIRDKTRRGEDPAIVTHSNKRYPAEWLGNLEIEKLMRDGISSLKKYNLIIIDEAQFFRHQTIIAFVEVLLDANIHVCIAGLAQDSFGHPFGAMGDLMAMADKIYLEKAKCSICKMQATRTQRLVKNDNIILVGGEKMFEPRCIKHWTKNP